MARRDQVSKKNAENEAKFQNLAAFLLHHWLRRYGPIKIMAIIRENPTPNMGKIMI